MGYFRKLLVVVFGAASLVGAGTVTAAAHGRGISIEFDSMTPVTGSAVGAVNDRGIPGGGLPWLITSGRGEVDRNGEVDVRVTGLVLGAGAKMGTNPIPSFSATVSCVTPHGIVNVTTAGFAATSTGDATIDGKVTLPRHCKHPEVFVGFTTPTGVFVWFAQSNLGDEGED